MTPQARKTRELAAPSRKPRPRASKRAAEPLAVARLAFAAESLARSGKLRGARTKKLSVRVDPGLIEAARARTGIASDSDLITAALAVVAAPDDFGPWLVAQAGRLPKDFELDF
jgi:hypothetical protein